MSDINAEYNTLCAAYASLQVENDRLRTTLMLARPYVASALYKKRGTPGSRQASLVLAAIRELLEDKE